MSSGRYAIVTTTTAERDAAERIAGALVERRLAACVQIDGPLASIYRWNGAVERAIEFRCTAKTKAPLVPSVVAAIRELHDYEVPEIIVTPIVGGSPAYLTWIDESTSVPATGEIARGKR